MFSKKIEPRCMYCKRGIALNDSQMVCPKKGIVTVGDSCRAFRYDPLKRVPPRHAVLELSKLRDEDFSL